MAFNSFLLNFIINIGVLGIYYEQIISLFDIF